MDAQLSALILKIRKITARPSANQITNDSIIDYINLFYESDFPQQLKIFDFRTLYSFVTQPGVDKYTLSVNDRNNYKSFEPPVYCSNYYLNFYENRELFKGMWPDLPTTMNFSIGTGVAGPYVNTLTGVPIIRGSVLISVVGPAGTTLVAQDDSLGFLTGDVVPGFATIDYATGLVGILWNAAIPVGNVIVTTWTQYAAARPQDILFYDNYFILRPVPDQAYNIQMQAFLKPTAYSSLNTTVRPFLDDYFQLLAYGAALKIFTDSLEMENAQMIRPLYLEQLSFCERKTMMQIKAQRTATIYGGNVSWPGRSSVT